MNQIVSESAEAAPDEPGSTIETSAPYFFAPSTIKFAVMSLCTFGLYEAYWFYNNWALIKARTNSDVMPFWRAVFSPLWAYSCFRHVKVSAGESRTRALPPIEWLAAAYFLLQALWRLPNPYWLVSLLSFVPIIPVNVAALEVNRAKGVEDVQSARFSPWNWMGVLFGGGLLVFELIAAITQSI